MPEDFEKYAEVLAGIVRHYNAGWANGYKWGTRYWEIWNEPDGITNCWGGGWDAKGYAEKFVRFFAPVLKRLTSEFPDVQAGGPAPRSLDTPPPRLLHSIHACYRRTFSRRMPCARRRFGP